MSVVEDESDERKQDATALPFATKINAPPEIRIADKASLLTPLDLLSTVPSTVQYRLDLAVYCTAPVHCSAQ